MVGNIVDVGWATIKSGCLPITGIEERLLGLQQLWDGRKGEMSSSIFYWKRTCLQHFQQNKTDLLRSDCWGSSNYGMEEKGECRHQFFFYWKRTCRQHFQQNKTDLLRSDCWGSSSNYAMEERVKCRHYFFLNEPAFNTKQIYKTDHRVVETKLYLQFYPNCLCVFEY